MYQVGGAILFDRFNQIIEIYSSSFVSNTASKVLDGIISAGGGAILFNTSNTEILLEACIFSSNKAQEVCYKPKFTYKFLYKFGT